MTTHAHRARTWAATLTFAIVVVAAGAVLFWTRTLSEDNARHVRELRALILRQDGDFRALYITGCQSSNTTRQSLIATVNVLHGELVGLIGLLPARVRPGAYARLEESTAAMFAQVVLRDCPLEYEIAFNHRTQFPVK